jgi:acetolactate synthase I/II/III large subunit
VSRQPILIAGAALRSARGVAALKSFAMAHGVPVALTWKNQDLFDNSSPLYAGHLGFGNPPAHRKALAAPTWSSPAAPGSATWRARTTLSARP